MFEITASDIALLNDEDLRALVGLLCESEVRMRGFSAATVTWGGDQNAVDGGFDVRVALSGDAVIGGFVPRPATGLQVKKQNMPRTEILAEMRPHGALRPSIRELADQNGAYIIVSSSSVSDLAHRNRLAAMAEAVKDLPNPDALKMDFYDRTRLATWVRGHAGLILWVREKIGRTLHGWRAYGSWAYSPQGIEDEYLLDDKLRIRADADPAEGGLRVQEAIKRIRDRLREPRTIVRLVGLSGVGKTRLVQALFDSRVGANSLDPSVAVYTNMADGPDPQPTTLVSDLTACRQAAILVVDNCPPDLHTRLSELCRSPDSVISLITIEYDIREDQPEGTSVFALEPSSTDLLEKLIHRRFPAISPVDARTIAEFSGGNGRIAVALAETLGKNETIRGLPDEDLFKRLFQQRNDPSESLLRAAQALSLLYSFDGEDVSETANSELFRLGALVKSTPLEMFRSAAQLEQRGLVQRRGIWRAVLPHAIANRLAAMALQSIPFSEIEGRLLSGESERLLKSFSRRLGYLDASRDAQSIVKRWLEPGGLLANPARLSEVGQAMLNNVAPVAPEAALAALERVLLKQEEADTVQECKRYIRLLRSLAYDSQLFDRCAVLLAKLAQTDEVNDKNEAAKVFASLFLLYLSGTRAPIEQRLAFIASLLQSDHPKRQALGLMALRAALEAWHFGAADSFEFGARSRDYGYWPSNPSDVKHWFASALLLAETVACTEGPVASQARSVIANQFRGLWTGAAMYEQLERVCRNISAKGFWPEGWIAVRQTMHFDSRGLPPEGSLRLAAVEALLRAANLVQDVRSIVLSNGLSGVGLDSEDDRKNDVASAIARVEAKAQDLGRAITSDDGAFSEVLPELVTGEGQLWSFGRGLAEAAEEPASIWNRLVAQLTKTDESKRKLEVLGGFLNVLHAKEPDLADLLLDNALNAEVLSSYFPLLQTTVGIDERGLNRLRRSLTLGRAPIRLYRCLSGGRATDPIAPLELKSLLLEIAAKPGGWDVAIDILYMRLFSEESQKRIPAPEIVDAGRELMISMEFTRSNTLQEYRLGIICKHCLTGDRGAEIVRSLCRKFGESVAKYETYAFYHEELLQGLFGVQPIAAFDGLFSAEMPPDRPGGITVLHEIGELRGNPLYAIPADELLSWCDQQPHVRYAAIAAVIAPFYSQSDKGQQQWTSVALKLIERAPEPVEVLKRFVARMIPTSWVGSRSAIIQSNASLLDDFAEHPDPAVQEFIATEKAKLPETIKAELDLETLLYRQTDERFE